jgi:PEP-CTERM motif
MRNSCRKLVLAAFCLLLLPVAAFADGIVIGPCGNANIVGVQHPMLGPCALAGGGTASYGAQAVSAVNFFFNLHSPVTVTGNAGQINTFMMTVQSLPQWTIPGPVLTLASLNGTVTIRGQGASVDILFTGLLGGPQLSINQHFVNNATFSVTITGEQAIANLAVSTLVVVINGDATFESPDSGEFTAVPEPATLILFGTGLTGIAVKTRKRLRRDRNVR